VVGNPCNTNCLIARSHAPDVPADRWFAMTRLDENRAKSQLARRANVPVELVTNLAIWGNHSATQFPDFANARVDGVPVPEVIDDSAWLQGEFIETVQKRGAKVIEARGASSAASAANAAIDAVNSVWRPTAEGQFHSLAVASNGEYGAPEGLQFGFPVHSTGDAWTVVEGLEHDDFAQDRIRITTDELVAERDEVKSLGLIYVPVAQPLVDGVDEPLRRLELGRVADPFEDCDIEIGVPRAQRVRAADVHETVAVTEDHERRMRLQDDAEIAVEVTHEVPEHRARGVGVGARSLGILTAFGGDGHELVADAAVERGGIL
jgi:hypothetical protein